jgi:cell division protease FtsH
MSEAMDNFIKNTLDERYDAVKKRLEEYRDAIEKMVELLYAKENITGDQVRAIIEVFETENNIPTKLSPKKENSSDDSD